MTKKVDAVTISVSKPESYEGILSLSGEELLTKVRDGDIVVPKSESRDAFIKFASKSKEEREEFIKSIKPASGSTANIPPDTSGKKPEDISGGVEGRPEAGSMESGDKPDSQKSPEESHQELLSRLGALTSEVNKHRGNAGKLGKKVKELTASLDAARSTISELEKKSAPVPKDAPVMPDMPDPENFVEGYMDPEYREAQKQHHKEMKQYYADLAEYQNSTRPSWANELAQQLDETTKIAKDASDRAQSVSSGTTDNAWDSLWNEAAKLQKTLNLSTSLDIKVINDNQIIVNNKNARDADGNPYYTQDVINSAVLFLNKVSPEDYEKYSKITKIVNQLYTVDETGIPSRNFADRDENSAYNAAIALAGLTGHVKALQMTQPSSADLADRLSRKQAENNNLSSGMPASQIGAHDDKLDTALTEQEKKEKLLDLNRQIRSNQKLLKDPQFMENFNKLRSELGLARK